MKYTAKGEHNRHFELYDADNNSMGRIDYTGWFSIKADIKQGGNTFHVAPSNIWHTTIHVIQGNHDVAHTAAELKVNWAGNMVIKLPEGKSYLFKAGFWHNKYTLYTEEEQGIITLHPDFQWKNFSFNYEIETNDNYDEGKNALLILVLIYCCNHIHSRGAVAAV